MGSAHIHSQTLKTRGGGGSEQSKALRNRRSEFMFSSYRSCNFPVSLEITKNSKFPKYSVS